MKRYTVSYQASIGDRVFVLQYIGGHVSSKFLSGVVAGLMTDRDGDYVRLHKVKGWHRMRDVFASYMMVHNAWFHEINHEKEKADEAMHS